MSQYYVLMADLKKSRTLPSSQRNVVQELLDSSMRLLNMRFRNQLAKEVVFSAGDEIQGLFTDFAGAFLYFRLLNMIMMPGRMRAGIGAGTWDVRIESGSTGQDGPVYHCARRAIEHAKGSRLYDVCYCSGRSNDGFMTVELDHSFGICASRTKAQNDLALFIELLHPVRSCRMPSNDSLRASENELLDLINLRCEACTYGERISQGSIFDNLDCFQESSFADFRKKREESIRDFKDVPDYDFAMLEDGLRGITYEIESITGLSRQGLDRKMAGARVAQERNAALAIAKLHESALMGEVL